MVVKDCGICDRYVRKETEIILKLLFLVFIINLAAAPQVKAGKTITKESYSAR